MSQWSPALALCPATAELFPYPTFGSQYARRATWLKFRGDDHEGLVDGEFYFTGGLGATRAFSASRPENKEGLSPTPCFQVGPREWVVDPLVDGNATGGPLGRRWRPLSEDL